MNIKNAALGATTVVVFFVLGLGSSPTSPSGSTPSPSPDPAPKAEKVEPTPAPEPPRPATPDVTVGAKELLHAYHENQVAADARFKGKRLRVSGSVYNVTTGFLGGVTVAIDGGGQFEIIKVQCEFDKATEGMASLKKGDRITHINGETPAELGPARMRETFGTPKPIRLTVEREGEQIELIVTPA